MPPDGFATLRHARIPPDERLRRVRACHDAMSARRSVREFSPRTAPHLIVVHSIVRGPSSPTGAAPGGTGHADPHARPHGLPPADTPPASNGRPFALIPVGYPADGAKVQELAKELLNRALTRVDAAE
jgi:hypothetical protein